MLSFHCTGVSLSVAAWRYCSGDKHDVEVGWSTVSHNTQQLLQLLPELQVLSQDTAKQAQTMNNGYFFGLLDRMISGKMHA